MIDHTWDESKYDLNELVAKVNMLGKAAMWICAVTGDVRNSDSNIIVVKFPLLFRLQYFRRVSTYSFYVAI